MQSIDREASSGKLSFLGLSPEAGSTARTCMS